MINLFFPSTQSIQTLTIFLLQRELLLLSSCKFWNINIFFFKELGHDFHIYSEEIFFMIWTYEIITFWLLSLTLHPLGFWILISWTWPLCIRMLLLLHSLLFWIFGFLLAFGLIRNTYSKGLILGGFDGTHLHQFVLFPTQRLHEVFQGRNSTILNYHLS